MNFDFENPHTMYVLAAYGIALLGYAGLVVHTFLKSCAVRNATRSGDKQK